MGTTEFRSVEKSRSLSLQRVLQNGDIHAQVNGTTMTDYTHRPEQWDERGCSLCETEQFSEAVAAFDQAIALDSTYCKAWSNRGNALCGLKRSAEALASYDRAVALQPDYHQAWFNRGLLLAEMSAFGNALESYERAIALHPDPRYLHAKEDILLKQKIILA